jgi:hypothetical protein
MTADRVAMIDWDESHVDVPDLDLALPHNAAGLGDDAYDIAAQARAAWEAAVCWDPTGTDQFAVKRLAEVRAVANGRLPQQLRRPRTLDPCVPDDADRNGAADCGQR